MRPVLCVQLMERKYVIELEKPKTNNKLWTVANLPFSLLYVRTIPDCPKNLRHQRRFSEGRGKMAVGGLSRRNEL